MKKILALPLAAAALVILFAQGTARRTVAKYLDDTEGNEPPAQMFGKSNRAHLKSHIRPSVLNERFKAVASAQDGQAGSGGGAGPVATSEPPEVSLEGDDDAISVNGMPEDRSLYPWEPSPQFWRWRRTWADDVSDATWAAQLRSELTPETEGGVRSTATIHQVDCRETICQLYVHADDAKDAEAIFASMNRAPRLGVEHEQLGANDRGWALLS